MKNLSIIDFWRNKANNDNYLKLIQIWKRKKFPQNLDSFSSQNEMPSGLPSFTSSSWDFFNWIVVISCFAEVDQEDSCNPFSGAQHTYTFFHFPFAVLHSPPFGHPPLGLSVQCPLSPKGSQGNGLPSPDEDPLLLWVFLSPTNYPPPLSQSHCLPFATVQSSLPSCLSGDWKKAGGKQWLTASKWGLNFLWVCISSQTELGKLCQPNANPPQPALSLAAALALPPFRGSEDVHCWEPAEVRSWLFFWGQGCKVANLILLS